MFVKFQRCSLGYHWGTKFQQKGVFLYMYTNECVCVWMCKCGIEHVCPADVHSQNPEQDIEYLVLSCSVLFP